MIDQSTRPPSVPHQLPWKRTRSECVQRAVLANHYIARPPGCSHGAVGYLGSTARAQARRDRSIVSREWGGRRAAKRWGWSGGGGPRRRTRYSPTTLPSTARPHGGRCPRMQVYYIRYLLCTTSLHVCVCMHIRVQVRVCGRIYVLCIVCFLLVIVELSGTNMLVYALLLCRCFVHRAAEVRQELPAALDQLPESRGEEGEHLQGGGRRHHQAPCHPWEQVRGSILVLPHSFYSLFLERPLMNERPLIKRFVGITATYESLSSLWQHTQHRNMDSSRVLWETVSVFFRLVNLDRTKKLSSCRLKRRWFGWDFAGQLSFFSLSLVALKWMAEGYGASAAERVPFRNH